MKKFRFFVLMILAMAAVPVMAHEVPVPAGEESSGTNQSEAQEPIACQFSGSELDLRTSSVLQLLSQYEEVREFEDGYSLRFPGNDEWTERLISFVVSERGCCSFFKFKVTFEPNNGDIWLYMGGSSEIKAFIDSMTE